jgi:DNA-binding GntR family transcriptional regulator
MTKAELPPLAEIQNRSRRAQVLDALRDAILDGDLKPGQPLTESDLATQLGVSRAPLREAMQVLNAEGLVEVVPYRGTTVKPLSMSDIEEVYNLRILLETFALQRIIERGDPDAAVAQLRAIYANMQDAARQGNINRVSEHDREFHKTVIILSRHNLLLSVWHVVSMRVRQIMALRNRQNRDLMQIARNHLPIIESIEKRDFEMASRAIHEHIASAADLIIEGWEGIMKPDGDGGK